MGYLSPAEIVRDCMARAKRTAEQKARQEAEIRAAFGPGKTVVNVITGERIHT